MRPLWRGFCAVVKLIQGYRAITWLFDSHDPSDFL